MRLLARAARPQRRGPRLAPIEDSIGAEQPGLEARGLQAQMPRNRFEDAEAARCLARARPDGPASAIRGTRFSGSPSSSRWKSGALRNDARRGPSLRLRACTKDKIIERSADEASGQREARPDAPSHAPRDRDYDDRYKDDRYKDDRYRNDPYYHKRKRKGLLGELFDFD